MSSIADFSYPHPNFFAIHPVNPLLVWGSDDHGSLSSKARRAGCHFRARALCAASVRAL